MLENITNLPIGDANEGFPNCLGWCPNIFNITKLCWIPSMARVMPDLKITVVERVLECVLYHELFSEYI